MPVIKHGLFTWCITWFKLVKFDENNLEQRTAF